MGASHTFAQSSSLVGNVGVVAFAGPPIFPTPNENLVVTGPYKSGGSSRREWVGSIDQLKDSFAHMVISERGNRLRMTKDELVQGRIYPGLDAVRLGLADDLGGDADAFEKAAELAGISNYGLVDVNLEVLRRVVKDIRDVYNFEADDTGASPALAVLARDYTSGDAAYPVVGSVPGRQRGPDGGAAGSDIVRTAGSRRRGPASGLPVEHQRGAKYLLPVHGK